jgi:predicted nucleotidyltransferase component of viral defense system
MAQKAKSILTSHQKKILELISKEKYFTQRFYLTGGTALAEFYLKHRISEDLDFFTEKEEVNPIPIARFLNLNSKKLELVNFDTKKVLGLYSFFLHFKDNQVLKVDFNFYPFPRIEKGLKFNSLEINSIYDIAVDKVHTVVLQPRARDFIDLYFIIKEKKYDFFDLLMQAKAKFDWHISAIELGARLMEASKLKDYPRMIKKINHQEWKNFFLEQAKKLKKEIFE